MVTPENVNSIYRLYNKVSLWLIAAALLIGLLAIQVVSSFWLVKSLLFTAAYSLVVTIVYGRCWKSVALRSPNVLTRFYMAASTLKMILALVVILVGMVVLRASKPQLLGFVGIFAGFYLLLLIFDSVFFARVEKNKKNYK
ncbi:hypothetical protein [Prevotella sp. KH2C16]|uniref:hypothetical protein n=1 Tax=Prevotella sp. KH2C16 TaxID=1855325 RepID=UPI0008EE93E0|nr:hypothetical protein [Prevotella sp. KH2C16]SFF97924.1 hypothetical protein SAMN05216383_10381 [Prevotella sp. KH2C16]